MQDSESATLQHFRVNGLHIHYQIQGPANADSILFIHGSGLSLHTWTPVVRSLSGDNRCIRLDLRGHGESDWSPEGVYSLQDYASDVAAVLDKLRLRAPTIVGMSLGGQVALRLLIGGVQARALILVDSGPELRPVGEGTRRRRFLQTHTYPSLDDVVRAALEFNPRRPADDLRRTLPLSMRQLPTGEWQWKWDPRRLDGLDARRMETAKLWDSLPCLSQPTLIVRGEYSDSFTAAQAEKLRDALPNASITTIPGAGHTVQGDQPDALAQIIRDFLAAQRGESPPPENRLSLNPPRECW